MNRDPQTWARLGQALRNAREHLGHSQDELAALAHVSTASVQSAEAGTVPKSRMPFTLASIARALGWPQGAVDEVLAGAEPPGSQWRDVPVQQQLDAEQLAGIMTNAMVRATSKTTSDEIKEATRIALDELRRHGYLAKTDGVQLSTNGENT
jgi:DNA-binding XRE family transcriptional regulator